MTIKVGDKLPNVTFRVMTAEGPKAKTTDDIFKGKTVALFAMPGAFTSTCSKSHMPSIVTHADAIKAKGVQTIAVTCVNDPFVMKAWQDATDPNHAVEFLADGNADFAKATGLDIDLTGGGLGVRSKRYSMLVKDGVVASLNIEDNPGEMKKSSPDGLVKAM